MDMMEGGEVGNIGREVEEGEGKKERGGVYVLEIMSTYPHYIQQ